MKQEQWEKKMGREDETMWIRENERKFEEMRKNTKEMMQEMREVEK